MASANICDRCGKLIPNEELFLGLRKHKGYSVTVNPMLNMFDSIKQYDLCVDCVGELRQWLKKE